MATVVNKEAMLFSHKVTYEGGNGHKISLDAVYQDTMPEGGARATVFAQHGAPGSHKDYKYIVPGLREKGIRTIAINYPGHGVTENDRRLTWTNTERNNYTKAIIDGLNLKEKKDLIFMGHSRGAENSIQLGALHLEDSIGIVLLNSPGVLVHKGYRNYGPPIRIIKKFIDNNLTRNATYKVINWTYNNFVKLRVPSGEVASVSMLPILTFDFEGMIPFCEAIEEHKDIKVFYGFTGDDFLIETEVSEDLARRLGKDRQHFVYKEHANDETNKEIGKELAKSFSEGRKVVTALFEKDDHHLNKRRAHCVVEAIDAMVTEHEKKRKQ